jgi:2-methylcitrate dehydratase PrpD
MSQNPDISHDFANFVTNSRYESLSPDAIEGAKKSIFDTLGVTMAASGMEPAVRSLVETVKESGGTQEASILGFGGKVPAMMAAFANGAMSHSLDFDDQTPWGAHPDSSVVPSTLALAERKGGITGKQLITAVAVGQDMFARFRQFIGWRQDWNFTSAVGVFSAAAAASHVLGLNRQQTAHAFGIASMQACGTMELIFGIGSDLRGMYAGFTSKGAVLAALLAQKGITGIGGVFEGKTGIFNTYFGGRYDREKMLQDLGTNFMGGTTLYKAWPAVGNSHTYIHATLELMKEARLSANDIEEIRVYVGDFTQEMCTPLEIRRAPSTLVDAKFSLPFLVGIAAAKGRMGVSQLSPEGLRDPEVLAMAKRVVPVDDPTQDWKMKLPDGRIEITTRDGRKFERLGDYVPGSAEAPMTWDQLTDKFKDCASVAAVPPAVENVEKAIEFARNLETADDATDIVRLLC